MPIHVLHIIEAFGAGTFTALVNVCSHTRDVRHSVIHSLRPETPGDYASLFPEKTILRFVAMSREIAPVKDCRAFLHILAAMKELRPDVVHCHSSKAGVLGRVAARCLGIPSVYTPHGYSFLQTGIPAWRKRPYNPQCGHFSRTGATMAEKRYAVVLAAFGTTREQEEDYVGRMKEELQRRHPDTDVFDAFTSRFVATDRLAKGRAANALPQVLAELSACGYTHVAVQSLHVVPGMEFDMLCDITRRFSGIPKGIERARTGLPLIHDDASADRLAAELVADLPSEFSKERQPDAAVVFIGHGAKTLSGTLAYPALQACLWRRAPALFVGTVEGSLDAETILAMLRKHGARKAWLVPLLAYCGAHVRQDMFGAEKSWRTVLEAGGIQCVPVEKSLLARPAVTAMWLENALVCLEDLKTVP